ncbi:hypothetical protein [Fusibacter sp. JL216-2]|uniref:hypothetical protein n=1 Tax=Fusibacter sp. JL216-2 TaxID=3071453 RepID=UPI003D338DC0
MKRKIVSLLMSLALVVSVVGCAPKQTAREMLEESVAKSMEITSAEQDIKIHFGVDLGENPDPMMEMFASMLKDVNVVMNAKSIMTEKPQIEMTASAELSGMTYNAEIYMNEEQMAMKIPMMEPYIVQDLVTAEGESAVMTQEQAQEISKKVYDIILAKVTDEELVLEEGATVMVNGEEVKVNQIKLSLDDARTKEIFNEAFTAVMNDPGFREIMIASQKNQNAMMGIELTDEEISAQMDDMMSEFEEGWAEAVTYFTMDRFDMTFGLDDSNQMVSSVMAMDMTVTDPDTETTVKVNFEMDSTAYNINAIDSISFPELTEENSVTADELGTMGY